MPAPMNRPSDRSRSAPLGSQSWAEPWVQLKYFTFHPNVYPNMIAAASSKADLGDVVTVYDKEGNPFGHGFFNPDARVPLRLFQHGAKPLEPDHFEQALRQAASLRLEMLKLPEQTDAFRVVHSDADSIPGLMADKLGEVLAVEVSNIAAYQQLGSWLPILHGQLGTKHQVIHFDRNAMRAEDLLPHRIEEELVVMNSPITTTKIQENGMRFHVSFEHGHKTGFFCDQRDNRQKLGRWAAGAPRVLDVCSYTGGFSIAAKMNGAEEVTGIDLDEKAIETAKKNANLNQQRISFIHADAFTWMRQMQRNADLWDVVVLDPPKLIHSREAYEEGRAKYHDMNKLALSLVKRGGLFLTCSCSGLMPVEEFEEIVIGLAHRSGRRLQILDRTGAGPDHPVMSHCPESRYLKALWARVW
jgi:23S rRNA (cytosine1962-C5)-methyltransferase